jgi:hypothetical protein
MDQKTVTARIEAACGELGLNRSVAQRLAEEVLAPELAAAREQIKALSDENERLSADLRQLHQERERFGKIQAEMVTLLKAKSPDRILHDLRNVLNELTLLKAIAGDVT